jgi:GT2 family glycosyltransferase
MPDGRFYREYKPSFDADGLMASNLHNINCLVRRAAFERLGLLFDESLNYCEDYDLFLRLAEVGLIYHIPEVLHHRTEHGDNMSHNLNEMIRHEILVKQRMLQRRSLAG